MFLYWYTVKKLGDMKNLEKIVPVKVNMLSLLFIQYIIS